MIDYKFVMLFALGNLGGAVAFRVLLELGRRIHNRQRPFFALCFWLAVLCGLPLLVVWARTVLS